MKRVMGVSVVLVIVGTFLAFSMPSVSIAQWGLLKKGADAVQSGTGDSASKPADTKAAAGGGGSTAPVTYKNAARGFSYTIPAGWQKVEGDPNSESVGFMKAGSSWGFNVHMNQMTPSFPKKSSVNASLKQDKERVTIKQLLDAKRRDDGDQKKKCGVIGWETVEAPQKNGIQRITWQCYDGENYYINLMAYSSNEDFAAAQPTLRAIMDSIKFCQ